MAIPEGQKISNYSEENPAPENATIFTPNVKRALLCITAFFLMRESTNEYFEALANGSSAPVLELVWLMSKLPLAGVLIVASAAHTKPTEEEAIFTHP